MIIIEDYIKTRNVYLDKKSAEKGTNRVKKKYKLAGNKLPPELGVFIFFILMGSISACQKFLTIQVGASEWINRDSRCSYLLQGDSFIDVHKVEKLSTGEVRDKINDKWNGFTYVAEIPPAKFKKLQNKMYLIPRSFKPISPELERLAKIGLTRKVNETIQKLGI
ncbi:MAG: hypothetical protein PHD96_01315 [Candidatus Pacebacteria bacterium]|nr:hypothetical protein [Candidatus Paceibacterota bacterium]